MRLREDPAELLPSEPGGTPGPAGGVDYRPVEDLLLASERRLDARLVGDVEGLSEQVADVGPLYLVVLAAEVLDVGVVRRVVAQVAVPVGHEARDCR